MAFVAGLDRLPVELLEAVATLLDFRDICNLRLTARDVAAKSSHGVFKTYFQDKTIRLTAKEQLQEFVRMTQQDQMGCLIQNIQLVAPLAFRQQEWSKQSLGNAMEILCINSAHGCLLSVSMMVEGADNIGRTNWTRGRFGGTSDLPRVWKTAGQLFQATVSALEVSKLPVRSLDIFGSITRCSLACDYFSRIPDHLLLSDSLNGLKQLSISLSHHLVPGSESVTTRSLATGERHTTAICQFLSLCPNLEDLQIRWFYLVSSSNQTDALREEEHFFDRIAESSSQFSHLKRVTLKGIYTSEDALLSFLGKLSQLESLGMEEIHLGSRGKFRPVFDYLFQHRERLGLEHVHFDDLHEERLICFEGPGEPHSPTSDPSDGPNDRTRSETHARNAIRYRPTRGYTLDSAADANWRLRKYRLYGPY